LKRINSETSEGIPPLLDEEEEVRLHGEAVIATLPEEEEEEMSLSDDDGPELPAPQALPGQVLRPTQRIYCDDTTKFCQVRCKICQKLMAYDGILGKDSMKVSVRIF
jgi:hypothetical protein